MRSPVDVLLGRIEGLKKVEIARRTVPCYKHVIEPDGERLALCLLVDHKQLYRYPFENVKGARALAIKARYLKGEMEHLRLREFQPGICRYVHPRPEAVSA
ncbi:MAG TPA: hypothetical protein VFD49_25020 [Candidatus Dormibacteraeota bacterium]|nr:hypothetical protein [Candidatus Dormibacteraeota bacterium]